MLDLKTAQKPQIQPPEILIFFHAPKTGGTTMDAILSRCFPGVQHFDGAMPDTRSCLCIRPRVKIEARYHSLTDADRQAIRCVMGTHYPFGIHTMLERPAKYFTLLRPPVERSISHFLMNRKVQHQPFYHRIKRMTLDEYLDSGVGIDSSNCQVRLLSGCPELDAVWDPAGGRISAPPVEPRHLELAKRNIEQHFVAAAPMEAFNTLLLVLRATYGWKLRQILYVRHNVGDEGAHLEHLVSSASRRRLEEMNAYDTQLYNWARERFAEQTRALEPDLSRDLRRFEVLNATATWARRTAPDVVARRIMHLLARRLEPTKRLSGAQTPV
jgi:hypothetical protein